MGGGTWRGAGRREKVTRLGAKWVSRGTREREKLRMTDLIFLAFERWMLCARCCWNQRYMACIKAQSGWEGGSLQTLVARLSQHNSSSELRDNQSLASPGLTRMNTTNRSVQTTAP